MKKQKIKYPELLKQEYAVRNSESYKGVILLSSWITITILFGLVMIYG
ncbi:MAG: hypothetical protein RR585_04515 [Coprobacillus sp.]